MFAGLGGGAIWFGSLHAKRRTRTHLYFICFVLTHVSPAFFIASDMTAGRFERCGQSVLVRGALALAGSINALSMKSTLKRAGE